MAQGSILDGAKDTNGVNTEMAVETLVLGINKGLEESGVISSYLTGVRFSLKNLPMS